MIVTECQRCGFQYDAQIERCERCDHSNAIVLTELAAQARIAAAAIDYTHGRITIGELVRVAKDVPR